MKKIIIPCVIFLFFWILFSYRLDKVPPGINGDEASIGYNAILLSQNLKDETGRFLPLFISTLNKSDWKQPVTVYTTAVLFKIFGTSYFLLKQVTILFILISAGLMFYLLRSLASFKMAVSSLVIYLSVPILMIQSHLSLENVAPMPFVLLWLLMLFKYQKENNPGYLFWAGVSLGVSFYSYNGMRLIMPVLLALTYGYMYFKRLASWKSFTFGWLPFLVILPLVKSSYPGAIFGNNRPVFSFNYSEFFLRYLSNFDLSFLFITGDATPYHSTGKHGMFLIVTLPLFLVGSFYAIKKGGLYLLIFLAFILSPLFFGFVGSIHRASRLLGILPFFIILSTLGLQVFWQLRNTVLKIFLLSAIILFGLFNYYDFLNEYWFNLPGKIKEHFPNDSHIAYPALYKEMKELNLEPVVEDGVRYRENVASKFFELVFFPDGLNEWKVASDPPENKVILATADFEKLKKAGFKEKKLETPKYSLYIPENEVNFLLRNK